MGFDQNSTKSVVECFVTIARRPLVEITLRRGHPPEFLRSAGDAIHEALVAEANVPADDRFQIFHLLDPGQVIAHPTYGGVSRSGDLVVIRITVNAGRTTGVEVSKENWSFGKGVATYG